MTKNQRVMLNIVDIHFVINSIKRVGKYCVTCMRSYK